MATSLLPASVIKELTGLIRRFFWGKADKKRFLAYVAWDKITMPLGMGGLGVRDLTTVNEALMIKALWKLAMGSQALWAQVVRAKYLPRSQLWLSKRVYNCSVFWRCIMNLREPLKPCITWKVVNGETCKVFAEPWFPGATDHLPQQESHKGLRLCHLVDQQTGMWDAQLLIQLFGYQNCMSILSSIQPPNAGTGVDRLIFTLAANGHFSVKKAYTYLTGQRMTEQGIMPGDKVIWEAIWQRRDNAKSLVVYVEGNAQCFTSGKKFSTPLWQRGSIMSNLWIPRRRRLSHADPLPVCKISLVLWRSKHKV